MNRSLVKANILLIILYLSSHFSYSQRSGFEIILSSEYDEMPTVFLMDDADNFVGIILKAFQTDSSYSRDSFLYKINQSGEFISWKITKQDTVLNIFQICRIAQSPSGFLLQGTGFRVGEDPLHPFTIFIRIDNDWNVVWERIYRFNYNYLGERYHAIELDNGDILHGCSPQGGVHMFLFRMSAVGDSLNFASWSDDQSGELWDLTYNPDSTVIWMHTMGAYYTGPGLQVCSVVEIDNDLQYMGHMFYPEFLMPPYNSKIYSGNRLLTGASSKVSDIPNQEIDHMISAYILDNEMNINIGVYLTNPDSISRAAEMKGIDYFDTSTIYLGGTINMQDLVGEYPTWMYISKLDDTLGVVYEKYFGGDAFYVLFNVTAAPDGGVLLAGTRHEMSPTFIQRDAIIIKLDADGSITGFPDKFNIPFSNAIVYPNPGNKILNIRTALNNCTFLVFDASGRQLLVKSIRDHITAIEMNDKPVGNYPYILIRQEEIITSGVWIKK